MKRLFSAQRKNHGSKCSATFLKRVILIVIALAAVSGIALNSYSSNINMQLSDSLIRLHVIANSDSPQDQSLKRDVRDAVVAYVKGELSDSKSIEQTKQILKDKLEKITTVAKSVILKEGFNYQVQTMLGHFPFPTKSYGDISLPAGTYQALRIVIGNGEGANWWCVLFPPLCFVDVTHGTVPDSVKEDLKEALTDEEYKILTTADEEADIPIRIKFKIVEFFQDSKVKFTGALNKILKGAG